MKLCDGRLLSRKTQECIRIRAVLAVREDGQSPETVIQSLRLDRSNIYSWLRAYDRLGVEGLKSHPAPGKKPKLSENQRNRIAHIMRKQTPLKWGFDTKLWTSDFVKDVIERQFGIVLCIRAVRNLLKKNLGLSFQKPLQRAYQQDPIAVEKWKSEEFPKIKLLAIKEKAAILFADESSVKAGDKYGSTWGTKGQRPVVPHNMQHCNVSAISAIGAKGEFRFMTVLGSVNAKTFKSFLQRLVYGISGKIILILDNSPVHKAKLISQYVQGLKGRLKIFFLPPYAPELNPDEIVWSGLKRNLAKKSPAINKFVLANRTTSYLASLQRDHSRLLGCFGKPETVYAAA